MDRGSITAPTRATLEAEFEAGERRAWTAQPQVPPASPALLRRLLHPPDPALLDRPDRAIRRSGDIHLLVGPQAPEDVHLGRLRIEQMGDHQAERLLRVLQLNARLGEAAHAHGVLLQ